MPACPRVAACLCSLLALGWHSWGRAALQLPRCLGVIFMPSELALGPLGGPDTPESTGVRRVALRACLRLARQRAPCISSPRGCSGAAPLHGPLSAVSHGQRAGPQVTASSAEVRASLPEACGQEARMMPWERRGTAPPATPWLGL